MIALMPHLVQVKAGQATAEQFTSIVDSLIHNRIVRKAVRIFPSVPCEVVQEIIEEAPALTLIDAWKLYRAEKGSKMDCSHCLSALYSLIGL